MGNYRDNLDEIRHPFQAGGVDALVEQRRPEVEADRWTGNAGPSNGGRRSRSTALPRAGLEPTDRALRRPGSNL